MYGVSHIFVLSIVLTLPVYRVHWLRARARFHRWSEELVLTKNEMEWSTRFFFTKAREWDTYISAGDRPGQIAYVEPQKAMWQAMGEESRKVYLKIRPDAHSRLASII